MIPFQFFLMITINSILIFRDTLERDYNMKDKPSALKVKSKIWIELEGEVVFGLGRIRIFEAIEKTGSMKQAAALLGMSYRAAWGKVTTTEERLQLQLVERSQGNRRSGTTLTPAGRELLRHFSLFQQEAEKNIDKLFESHISDMLQHLKQETKEN
jgi:molybdate transport system regulatory protein